MARELYEFQALIPAGTPLFAPVTIAVTMPVRLVRSIEWMVPPGPGGTMGWALAAAGQNIIPVNRDAWIVTDNEQRTWELTDTIESGAWQVKGYNTGLFDHTVYLRFLVDLWQDGQAAPVPAPIPVDQLAPLTADDLAALTNGTLSADALTSLTDPALSVPGPDGVA